MPFLLLLGRCPKPRSGEMISPDTPSHKAKKASGKRFFCFFSFQKKRRPPAGPPEANITERDAQRAPSAGCAFCFALRRRVWGAAPSPGRGDEGKRVSGGHNAEGVSDP